jgi:hypothetical protein
MRARAHRLDRPPELNVFYRAGGADELVPVEAARKEVDGATEVSFYPLWPGEYVLRSELPMQPAKPKIVVALPWAYLVAVLGAFVGSCLYALSITERGGRCSRRRILTGTLTGLALAAADFHRAMLPGGSAIPSFATAPALAALFDGLAGGWVGPGLIFFVVGRFFPGLSGPRENDAPPKPEPDALPAG